MLTSSSRSSASPNTVAVFHLPDAALLALELSMTVPGTVYAENPLVKSLAREAKTPAQLTLDRIRLLFAPSVTSQDTETLVTSKKASTLSKEDRLRLAPPIVVLGTAADERSSSETKPGEVAQESAPVPLDPSLTNAEFWRRARVLRIQDVDIKVLYNHPVVLVTAPLPEPCVGVPLMSVGHHVRFAKEKDVAYQWTTEDLTRGEVKVLSTSPVFTPTPDLAFQVITLRLSADPTSGMWTEIKSPRVQPAPLGMSRWKHTPKFVEAPTFRVVSYNILYDGFCTDEFSRKNIYSFCTDDMLKEENRALRIRRELIEYHADLICLQECGQRLFTTFILPSFRLLGYEGVFYRKSGSAAEGSAVLFREQRFEMLESSVITLNGETLAKQHPQVYEGVRTHRELHDALSHMTAIGAGLRLRDKETNRELVLGNTHLFYHADGCHIRILQAYMQMSHLHALATRGDAGNAPLPVISCGDYNCTHSTGAYRLFTTGQVEEDHESWEKGNLFFWGCDKKLGFGNEGVTLPTNVPPPPFGVEFYRNRLVMPFRMTDSYSFCSSVVPWTTYSVTFKEVVDYVFFSHNAADVVQAVPIPEEEELSQNIALPNERYASDHVALVVDLKLR